MNALTLIYDPDAQALSIRIRDGEVAETVELDQLVYVDIDAEGQPLEIEFVVAAYLPRFIERHGGTFALPDRVDATAGVGRSSHWAKNSEARRPESPHRRRLYL